MAGRRTPPRGRKRVSGGVPTPMATMRLYPTRFFPTVHGNAYTERDRSLYAVARVFETADDMYRWASANGFASAPGSDVATTSACVARSYTKGRARTEGLFCEVLFWRGRIGTEIVAHEFTHVALAYARRRRIAQPTHAETDTDPNYMQREEVVCYALGSMMRQFVNRAYAHGLYDAQ